MENVVHIRRLHKKTSKEDLRVFAETFGPVTRINVWYGFGTGIIEMANASDAALLLASFSDVEPAVVRGKVVAIGLGVAARDDQILKQSPANPAYVEKEIARCVSDMCKLVENKEIRRAANELRAKHNALIRDYTREIKASGRQRNDVCWEWLTTGQCIREEVSLSCFV